MRRQRISLVKGSPRRLTPIMARIYRDPCSPLTSAIALKLQRFTADCSTGCVPRLFIVPRAFVPELVRFLLRGRGRD